MQKRSTVFCDIDGTILVYRKFEDVETVAASLTPDALKLNDWADLGHHIILTTARPEYMRAKTESELATLGIKWDMLIMEIGRGPRILINDEEPNGTSPKAIAFSIERDSGLSNIVPDCLNN